MQTPDPSSERSFLQAQLATLIETFDQALKKDQTLGEVKKIFREMRLVHAKLDELEHSSRQASQISENHK